MQQLILCRRLHAEVTGNCKKKLQATVTEGLAQGPYVAASMGFEPTTLRSKGIDSTYAPPRPHDIDICRYMCTYACMRACTCVHVCVHVCVHIHVLCRI